MCMNHWSVAIAFEARLVTEKIGLTTLDTSQDTRMCRLLGALAAEFGARLKTLRVIHTSAKTK